MLLLWTFVLLTVHQCVSGAPGEQPDFMWEMLKSKYKSKPFEGTSAAGDPLLLTKYILNNQTDQARIAARVDSDLFLGKESYSGYLTVDKKYNSNLFFWYFPVSRKPVENTPWILWLQGGPGASSLYGLFKEIGPIVLKDDDNLEEMKYSWGKDHSLLFIDNPVGAGFSFADDVRGYATNQDTIAKDLYNALQQFLVIFPELRSAPLTIAGESYAGKHIPSIGIQIHRHKTDAYPINLQGLAIGNGFTDPETLATGYGDFLREVGLVDDKSADQINDIGEEIRTYIKKNHTLLAKYRFNILLDRYFTVSHLPSCYNFLDDNKQLEISYASYIQQDTVRRGLHVGNTQYNAINSIAYNKLKEDMMNSARPWLEELLDNYKVMLYNGHLDVIVGYRPSVHSYKALNFNGADEYRVSDRKVWVHNNLVAGYYKKGGNLLEVMVRGAGHMVPSDKPSAALGLISAFIRGLPLSKDTGHLAKDTYQIDELDSDIFPLVYTNGQ